MGVWLPLERRAARFSSAPPSDRGLPSPMKRRPRRVYLRPWGERWSPGRLLAGIASPSAPSPARWGFLVVPSDRIHKATVEALMPGAIRQLSPDCLEEH